MELLINNDIATRYTHTDEIISFAAVEGPFKKPISISKVLAVAYVIAAVVVALDLFVWRAV